MNGLRGHLADYLRLRRALGHRMAEAAWLSALTEFGSGTHPVID
ncbi:hypothetical protein ACQEVZ_40300 [Dactylosporangium sp. CA-152071]